ncbi:hypothetical protein StoSoilB3_01930 [Arthrobacter sp. StoSoilB3]|nr:hypothetical protein StoSoilB3_01930 [Arthrobacter sp. StoSoilB3]
MPATQPLAVVIDQILPAPESSATNRLENPVLLEVPSSVMVPAATAAPSQEQSGTVPAAAPVPTAAPPIATAPQATAPPAAPPATSPAGPAAGACTPDNIDIRRNDQVQAIKPIPANEQQYYTVLGCAEGWLAYSISDEGIRAIGLDGGNVYFNFATLQSNGRYLTDFTQLWTSVHNWDFLAYDVQNGKYATVQEGMDAQFATYGIPVRLRTQLVGPGPTAPTGTGTP